MTPKTVFAALIGAVFLCAVVVASLVATGSYTPVNAAEARKCQTVDEVVVALESKYPGIVVLKENSKEYVDALSGLVGKPIDVPDGLIVAYMENEGVVVLIGFAKGCAAGAVPIPRAVHDIIILHIQRSKV